MDVNFSAIQSHHLVSLRVGWQPCRIARNSPGRCSLTCERGGTLQGTWVAEPSPEASDPRFGHTTATPALSRYIMDFGSATNRRYRGKLRAAGGSAVRDFIPAQARQRRTCCNPFFSTRTYCICLLDGGSYIWRWVRGPVISTSTLTRLHSIGLGISARRPPHCLCSSYVLACVGRWYSLSARGKALLHVPLSWVYAQAFPVAERFRAVDEY